MKGIEMMLANMLGLKPDQMQSIFVGLTETAQSAAKDLQEIKERLVRMEANMVVPPRIENQSPLSPKEFANVRNNGQ